jgi:GT2 family glycosyltransferase
MSVAVVIATYGRPDDVARCLDALALQTRMPDDVVVVDASPDDRTKELVSRRPGVRYLRNNAGLGSTATSRAIGVRETRSDLVAFLDDDSIARPDWVEKLEAVYIDPRVGAVGGRVINSLSEVASADPSLVGRLLPDGRLTGNFAADTGKVVAVDHLLGANMSYRRAAIEAVGGIQDFYPGTCAREDSDLGLRMGLRGWLVMFAPEAVVDHDAGVYAKGKRFDRRYHYYTHRNHMVLLGRVYGLGSPYVRRYPMAVGRNAWRQLRSRPDGVAGRPTHHRARDIVAGATRVGADLAGLLAGTGAAIGLRLRLGGVPKAEHRGSVGGAR